MHVLNSYAEKKIFDHVDRKRLLNVITESFFDSKRKKYTIPRPLQMEQISQQIVDIFPSESKYIYYISRKENRKANPGGLLFNRFNNLNRKPSRSNKQLEAPIEATNNFEKVDAVPEMISKRNKMNFMSGDEGEAMDLWISTYDFRKSEIQDCSLLKEIVDGWPFFKQASAAIYVCTYVCMFG